jgi:hypothetical protein
MTSIPLLARGAILAVSALFATAAAASVGAPTPEALATAFCAYGRNDRGLDGFERLATPSLAKVVEHAMQLNARMKATYPDAEPPLPYGIPLHAQPFRAPQCAPGAAGDGKIAVVYPEANGRPGWTDTLLVKPVDGGVAIDDIVFATDARRNTLRIVLTKAFGR